jgi:molybdopterin converting factor small subunit
LGGVKKIIGEDSITITESVIKVSKVIDLLKKNTAEHAKLILDNIIIAVYGIDCSILGGVDASVKEGDEVTVVSIVHGGSGGDRTSQ